MDSGMKLVVFVIIGFIAGVSGKDIRAGKLSSIVVGMVAACVGGSLLDWSRFAHSLVFRMGLVDYDLLISLIMATISALFFLFLLHLIRE